MDSGRKGLEGSTARRETRLPRLRLEDKRPRPQGMTRTFVKTRTYCFSLMSADELPTETSTMSPSTTKRCSSAYQYDNISPVSGSDTVFISPGCNATRANPFNSFRGLSIDESRC